MSYKSLPAETLLAFFACAVFIIAWALADRRPLAKHAPPSAAVSSTCPGVSP